MVRVRSRFRARLKVKLRRQTRRAMPVICVSALLTVMTGSWLDHWDAGSMPPKREVVARRLARGWPSSLRQTLGQSIR
jgi:hypothetical protein